MICMVGYFHQKQTRKEKGKPGKEKESKPGNGSRIPMILGNRTEIRAAHYTLRNKARFKNPEILNSCNMLSFGCVS